MPKLTDEQKAKCLENGCDERAIKFCEDSPRVLIAICPNSLVNKKPPLRLELPQKETPFFEKPTPRVLPKSIFQKIRILPLPVDFFRTDIKHIRNPLLADGIFERNPEARNLKSSRSTIKVATYELIKARSLNKWSALHDYKDVFDIKYDSSRKEILFKMKETAPQIKCGLPAPFKEYYSIKIEDVLSHIDFSNDIVHQGVEKIIVNNIIETYIKPEILHNQVVLANVLTLPYIDIPYEPYVIAREMGYKKKKISPSTIDSIKNAIELLNIDCIPRAYLKNGKEHTQWIRFNAVNKQTKRIYCVYFLSKPPFDAGYIPTTDYIIKHLYKLSDTSVMLACRLYGLNKKQRKEGIKLNYEETARFLSLTGKPRTNRMTIRKAMKGLKGIAFINRYKDIRYKYRKGVYCYVVINPIAFTNKP